MEVSRAPSLVNLNPASTSSSESPLRDASRRAGPVLLPGASHHGPASSRHTGLRQSRALQLRRAERRGDPRLPGRPAGFTCCRKSTSEGIVNNAIISTLGSASSFTPLPAASTAELGSKRTNLQPSLRKLGIARPRCNFPKRNSTASLSRTRQSLLAAAGISGTRPLPAWPRVLATPHRIAPKSQEPLNLRHMPASDERLNLWQEKRAFVRAFGQ